MISTSFAQTLGVALQLASATAALAQAPVITVIAPLAQMNRTMRGVYFVFKNILIILFNNRLYALHSGSVSHSAFQLLRAYRLPLDAGRNGEFTP